MDPFSLTGQQNKVQIQNPVEIKANILPNNLANLIQTNPVLQNAPNLQITESLINTPDPIPSEIMYDQKILGMRVKKKEQEKKQTKKRKRKATEKRKSSKKQKSEDTDFSPPLNVKIVRKSKPSAPKRKVKTSVKKNDTPNRYYQTQDSDSDDDEMLVVYPQNSISQLTDAELSTEVRIIQRKQALDAQILQEEKNLHIGDEHFQKKRKKASTTPSYKTYSKVPMNEDGTPVLPIELKGDLVIHNLGTIDPTRPKFNARRYLWPIGFKSSRTYSSMKNLDLRKNYTSEIVDNGDEPKFTISCTDEEGGPIFIESPTASGAWAEVGKRVNDLKEIMTGKRMFTQLSGPEMFGFSHPTIAKILQDMPGAKECDKYKFQEFVEENEKPPNNEEN